MKSFKSTAWLLPQPVLIIGTYDKDGKPNAMNAAWGGQWDMHEIIISLGSHQTTDNLAENPEFTVAFATTETMVASDYVGIVSGRNTPEKMEKTGWTIEKAPNVNAPVFKEFPMTLECRVKQKLDESETGYYLIAEIVNILCDKKYLASIYDAPAISLNTVANAAPSSPIFIGPIRIKSRVKFVNWLMSTAWLARLAMPSERINTLTLLRVIMKGKRHNKICR